MRKTSFALALVAAAALAACGGGSGPRAGDIAPTDAVALDRSDVRIRAEPCRDLREHPEARDPDARGEEHWGDTLDLHPARSHMGSETGTDRARHGAGDGGGGERSRADGRRIECRGSERHDELVAGELRHNGPGDGPPRVACAR